MFRRAVLITALFFSSGLASDQPPLRPKIYGVAFVRIKSSDFQAASETYSKILGFGTGANSGTNGCTSVKNPCFLVNVSQHIELVPGHAGDPGSWLDEIGFSTSSVRVMRDYLLHHAVPVSEIKAAPNGGPLVEAQDPEGNRIAFVEPTAPAESRVGPSQISSSLVHAGFVAKDLHAMNKFYLDTLGFRLYWKGGFKDLPPGTPEKDADIDWFEIQVPDGSDWVEYMLNIPANADHRELGVQNHFCLGVRDMQKAVDQLHKNGLALDSKFADDKPEIGRDGKWQYDIYDPDLTRIELMEPAPARDPCCNPYTAAHPKL
jgi:catechol 2,3-dioxygenase-like lactoylglutathione lyase family enzyme